MLLFELAILYITFNMATVNLNKMIIYNNKHKEGPRCHCVKKTSLIEQFYRHCSGTAIFLKKVNFILSVSCYNGNTLKIPLTKP